MGYVKCVNDYYMRIARRGGQKADDYNVGFGEVSSAPETGVREALP